MALILLKYKQLSIEIKQMTDANFSPKVRKLSNIENIG